MKRVAVVVVLLAACGLAGWSLLGRGAPPASFRVARVERGDLVAAVSASGTIEPEEVIDVGAQVAGQIVRFGDDPRGAGRAVNFGSPVEKGTVLARIDDSLYKAQVDSARARVEQAESKLESADAQVAQAEAGVQRAKADLKQMQAKAYQSDRDYQRARRLRPSGAIADLEYDTVEATNSTNKANVAVGDATVAQSRAALKDARANVSTAKATLHDARAALQTAEVNLGYCTIRSPVKGVIVDRRVNIGQTVVSSLNAPSLFLIAKDLKRLQVWASVNEADVGNIHSGQGVTFSVDAYPGRAFKGAVAPDQPRLNASMTQNVVTYTVVVSTDNSDGKLLPYLTANLQFEVSKRTAALLVPNAALRWRPAPEQVAPEARDEYLRARGAGKPADAPAEKGPPDRGALWAEDGGFVRPVKVRVGLSDGVKTEIVGGEVREGDAVVVGESAQPEGDASSPFTPKLFGPKKQ
jgi:HlyD family secretion protein